MAQYKDIKDQEFYKKKNIPVGPKPEIHFYPDITDDALKSGNIDIDFSLSYIDTLNKINSHVDDIHTPQMAFANPKTTSPIPPVLMNGAASLLTMAICIKISFSCFNFNQIYRCKEGVQNFPLKQNWL